MAASSSDQQPADCSASSAYETTKIARTHTVFLLQLCVCTGFVHITPTLHQSAAEPSGRVQLQAWVPFPHVCDRHGPALLSSGWPGTSRGECFAASVYTVISPSTLSH